MFRIVLALATVGFVLITALRMLQSHLGAPLFGERATATVSTTPSSPSKAAPEPSAMMTMPQRVSEQLREAQGNAAAVRASAVDQ